MVEVTEIFRIMLSTTDPSAEFQPGRDRATINIVDNDREYNGYDNKYDRDVCHDSGYGVGQGPWFTVEKQIARLAPVDTSI